MIRLPPEITFEKRPLSGGGWCYDFHHCTLGTLGRILLRDMPDGRRTHIFCEVAEVAGDPDGPRTMQRRAVFEPLGLEIARQMASGLAKAHEHAIFHRDIKPSNVVVAGDGIARIIDFGLAKSSETTATVDGTTKGTPTYMSPEARWSDDVHRLRCEPTILLAHNRSLSRFERPNCQWPDGGEWRVRQDTRSRALQGVAARRTDVQRFFTRHSGAVGLGRLDADWGRDAC